MFGSQAAEAFRENKKKTPRQQKIDDFLYELPETKPDLELGDGLIYSLGTDAQSLFHKDSLTKKEEEDEFPKKFMEECDIENIKDTMDESVQVPKSIYFFCGGDSDEFIKTLEFIGLSSINREFSAFLLSDLGRKTMTQNKLSIHVESGDIFYDNHNTDENFYSFLLSQQNDEAAYVPKKIHIRTVLKHILVLFYKVFQSMTKKSLIFLPLKIQNIFFIVSMIL